MGTTALRQLLKSFCYNSPWNYAVLWKPRHEGQMILSWEDGYCDHSKPQAPVEIKSEIFYRNGAQPFSSSSETSAGDAGSEVYSVGLVVAKMSHLQYALGEGIVGKVASKGNHFWASYYNVSTCKVNFNLDPECPDEWLLQLASGIKTILLVSVLPLGVVQLGSLEVVAEDLAVVASIKDRFIHNSGNPILNRDVQTQSSSTLICAFINSFDEPSTSTISPLKSEDSDTFDSVKPSKTFPPALDPTFPLTLQDALRGSVMDFSETFICESENKIGVSSIGLGEISKSPSRLEMMESNLFGLSCREELHCYKYNMEPSGEFSGGTSTSYSAAGQQPFQDRICHSSASLLNFPKDCELHKALGTAFEKHTSEHLWNSSLSVDNICNSSTLIHKRDLTDVIEPTSFAKCCDAYLLEAVVASLFTGTCGPSDIYNGVESSLTSLEAIVTQSPPQNKSEESALVADDSIPWRNVTSVSLAGSKNELTPASASFKSTVGTFTDKQQLEKRYESMLPRKGMKSSNVNKRTKPGENQRPRPRDRQLIQDRIKELRELVPNGVKCSIDGLLGRTIGHMMYLRSITEQAQKLARHQEASINKNLRTKVDKQSGTTWAFEVGNEPLVCPIVVEDLSYPGHMLIEMLCDEQSLFLEIAQVIRSLDLTILKGATENRYNNTWAHFIVETSKGFRRTEIFWPLMHLLQRKRNTISSKI